MVYLVGQLVGNFTTFWRSLFFLVNTTRYSSYLFFRLRLKLTSIPFYRSLFLLFALRHSQVAPITWRKWLELRSRNCRLTWCRVCASIGPVLKSRCHFTTLNYVPKFIPISVVSSLNPASNISTQLVLLLLSPVRNFFFSPGNMFNGLGFKVRE